MKTPLAETQDLPGNIILWTERDAFNRACLNDALKSATQPVREAANLCRWNGDDLTCDGDIDREGYRNLYFYLSGYGDAQFQHGQNCEHATQPTAFPISPEIDRSEKAVHAMHAELVRLRAANAELVNVVEDMLSLSETYDVGQNGAIVERARKTLAAQTNA